MGLFGRGSKSQDGSNLAPIVANSGTSQASGLQRGPKESKRQFLQRAETEVSSQDQRIIQFKADLPQGEDSRLQKQKIKEQTMHTLGGLKSAVAKLHAEGEKLREEIQQISSQSQVAEAETKHLEDLAAARRDESAKLEQRLSRMRAAHAALAMAKSDASSSRPTGGGDVSSELTRNAGRITEEAIEETQQALVTVTAEACELEIERDFFKHQAQMKRNEIARLQTMIQDASIEHENMNNSMCIASSENKELANKIRSQLLIHSNAERENKKLHDLNEQLALEIQHGDARKAVMQNMYQDEVSSVHPVLAASKQSKEQADNLHEHRINEIAQALRVKHVRADASLNNSRAPSRLGDRANKTGPGLVIEAAAPFSPAGLAAEPLEKQLKEIVAAAREVAYGTAQGGIVRNAGRMLLGEVGMKRGLRAEAPTQTRATSQTSPLTAAPLGIREVEAHTGDKAKRANPDAVQNKTEENVRTAHSLKSQIAPKGHMRREFQGMCIGEVNKHSMDIHEPERFILITDPGQDNDDEMALLLLSDLVRRLEVQMVAVIANLRPANRRAALARGTMDMIGMADVPVGIGTDGGSEKHIDGFSKFISESCTGRDYFSYAWEDVQKVEQAMGTEQEPVLSEQLRIYDGQKLLLNKFREAKDKSLTLLMISSLKDAAIFLRSHEQLFVSKIKCVTLMASAQLPESQATAPSTSSKTRQLFQPADGHNNMFDVSASKFFYQRCQELGVPLIIISRFAAYGCPVQKYCYDLMVRCPVPHPSACRLQRAQRASIESLWQNVCAGDILPPRCNKQWFCDTFCDGEGADSGSEDSMWPMVKRFNMYDPLAVLAAIPNRRKQFFEPVIHIGPCETHHLIIGVSKETCGIIADKKEHLQEYLMSVWIKVAGRPWHGSYFTGEEKRPPELNHEQLTAALTPMKQYQPEDLERLNKNVFTLLNEEWPKLKNSSLLSTWQDRDRLMTSIGPAMLLVDPHTILRLGRIPHSAEQKTLTMEMAAEIARKEDKRFFIEMFSHRWYTPYGPDDQFSSKARVLCEWAKYRDSMKFRTFYWIDYACINQSDIAPGVTMLPLYISCCNNILCFDTACYEARAWCRVERLMFASFVAPNNEYVSPDFEYRENAEKTVNGEIKPDLDGKMYVPDPTGDDAELSFASDNPLIVKIKGLCTTHWAKCWKDGLLNIVKEKVGLAEVENLNFGSTELRMRKFS